MEKSVFHVNMELISIQQQINESCQCIQQYISLVQQTYTNAEKYLLKARELDKVNPDIQDAYKTLQFAKSEAAMNEGIKLFENSKNNEAIEQFNKALELCPENGYAHYYRGLTYDALAKNQNAVNDYILAVQYNPELTMAYYSMAVSYENLNNKDSYRRFLKQQNNVNFNINIDSLPNSSV